MIVTVTQREKASMTDCFLNYFSKFYRTENIFLYFYLRALLCQHCMYSFYVSIRSIVLLIDLRYFKSKYLLHWSTSSIIKIYNILC